MNDVIADESENGAVIVFRMGRYPFRFFLDRQMGSGAAFHGSFLWIKDYPLFACMPQCLYFFTDIQ